MNRTKIEELMIKRDGLLTCWFLVVTALSNAQSSSCPQGFAYLGTLSGIGSVLGGFDERLVLTFPQNAMLDESYHQTKVLSRSREFLLRNSSARRNTGLHPKDIPKGILIMPYGSRDNDTVWAVTEPQLIKSTEENDNGTSSTRYKFGMHLFCSIQGSASASETGYCNVEVEVCYKPKSDR